MRMISGARAVLALLVPALTAAAEPPARVKVTQRYLVPVCLDGVRVPAGQRGWRLPAGDHSLLFTMRNAPRGVLAGGASPGYAAVAFTAESAHRYEVEVRAAATAFTERVWPRGEWKPVVRDRTPDHLVSTEPEWRDAPCPVRVPVR